MYARALCYTVGNTADGELRAGIYAVIGMAGSRKHHLPTIVDD